MFGGLSGLIETLHKKIVHKTFFIVLWLPPKFLRNSEDYVLVMELLNEDQMDNIETTGHASGDISKADNPYNGVHGGGNIEEKELVDANDDGVVIFILPSEKIKKLHIRGVRVRVVDADYQSSKSSEVVKIKGRKMDA